MKKIRFFTRHIVIFLFFLVTLQTPLLSIYAADNSINIEYSSNKQINSSGTEFDVLSATVTEVIATDKIRVQMNGK